MKGIYRLETKDLDYYARIKCCSCLSEVKLEVIKEQYSKDNLQWGKISLSGSIICGYCLNSIAD